MKVVILDSGTPGFVEGEQTSRGFVDFGTGLDDPELAAMAEALGIRASASPAPSL